jgi:hypothetical protein
VQVTAKPSTDEVLAHRSVLHHASQFLAADINIGFEKITNEQFY